MDLMISPIMLPLTNGGFTLIDREDLKKVEQYKWFKTRDTNGLFYVMTSQYPNKTHANLRLQRFLMNPPQNKVIDHINSNPLDNRKQNLRIATKSQNAMNAKKQKNNTSGERGVFFIKKAIKKKWWAYIWLNNKRYTLGCYETLEEARKIRREAALKYHGEFANI